MSTILKHIEDKQEQVRNWSPRLVCFNMVELMGGDSVSLNWWPGNRGTALLKQWREKYRRNSDAID